MPNGGGFALAHLCRSNMIALVVPCPIPLDRPALKDVETCCPEEPQNDIEHVGPPSDVQPFLVDQKQTAVEEEERKFDEGEGRAYKHHAQPDMLQDRIRQDCHRDTIL